VNGIELTYYVQETPLSGYVVAVHLDSPTGEKLGEVTIGPGAAKETAATATITFPTWTGNQKHALYLVFKAADPAEKAPVGIDFFRLIAK
jgi:cytochrome c